MILNGLGFVSSALYLYSEYFEDKPVSHLLDCPVEAEHITDDVLSRYLRQTVYTGGL